MRPPYPLAANMRTSGEHMLSILANVFYIFGEQDEPDTEMIRERLSHSSLYPCAGELLLTLFLLREGNFQLQVIGQSNTSGRMQEWLGTQAMEWLKPSFSEVPRRPSIRDIDELVYNGAAIIATVVERYRYGITEIPASFVLIAGQDDPVIYSPEEGRVHPFDNRHLDTHWDAHGGIIAIWPRQD